MSKIPEYLFGDTVTFRWVNSAVNMNPSIEVYNGSEQLVNTGTMADSGNGHYYYWWQTQSGTDGRGYYVGKMQGVTGGKTFVRDVRVKLVGGGVD